MTILESIFTVIFAPMSVAILILSYKLWHANMMWTYFKALTNQNMKEFQEEFDARHAVQDKLVTETIRAVEAEEKLAAIQKIINGNSKQSVGA